MKKRIGVITADTVLYNKIRLLLREIASVSLIDASAHGDGYDLIFADARVLPRPDFDAVLIGDGGDMPLFFRHEDLLAAVSESRAGKEVIILASDGQTAHLGQTSVKLTEQEYKLLSALAARDGFVTKRELLHTVWGEGYDEGVVNVYVYYLRKKLEKDGKRVIISSRNEGYKINEAYRRKD